MDLLRLWSRGFFSKLSVPDHLSVWNLKKKYLNTLLEIGAKEKKIEVKRRFAAAEI